MTEGPIYLQAQSKYQILVDEFLKGLLPWEVFILEISRRTGTERPDETLLWVKLVEESKKLNLKVKLIEPDFDKLMKKVEKVLKMDEGTKTKVIQEARLWFLSNSGYMKHFYAAFDDLFYWLPFHLFFRQIWLKISSFFVHLIPGDQKDVMVAVNKAYDIMTVDIANKFKKAKRGVLFLEESIARSVEQRLLEM